MKKLLLILLFLSTANAFSQDCECGWYGTKTAEERRKVFPFNKAEKVILIAFNDYQLSNKEISFNELTIEQARLKFKDSLILNKWRVIRNGKERFYFSNKEKIISQFSIDSLSHILINYDIKKAKSCIVEEIKCYMPHNAVIFLNDTDEVIASIEICFSCSKVFIEPINNIFHLVFNVPVGDCPEQLNMIKQLFIQNGITYGTSDTH